MGGEFNNRPLIPWQRVAAFAVVISAGVLLLTMFGVPVPIWAQEIAALVGVGFIVFGVCTFCEPGTI